MEIDCSSAVREHVAEFVDHYTSNGWKIGGRAAMVDWRAAFRNWVRKIGAFDRPAAPARFQRGRSGR
jgi:hypothetical protein